MAVVSLWLVYATAMPEVKNDGNTRHDPDYTIHQMNLRTFDTAGQLQYTLLAKELHHYPDDGSTTMLHPQLIYTRADRPTVFISADEGIASHGGKIVKLVQNIQIKREATTTRFPLIGTMPDLTIDTEHETAYTPSEVRFTEGESWLKGMGMYFDNRTQQYTLESNAIGQFIRTPRIP